MAYRQDEERYRIACHAMQSGVATEIGAGVSRETEPKHLRVGINSAMVEHAALAKLLMKRGIITDTEYMTALADQMEEEVKSYKQRISVRLGVANIELV